MSRESCKRKNLGETEGLPARSQGDLRGGEPRAGDEDQKSCRTVPFSCCPEENPLTVVSWCSATAAGVGTRCPVSLSIDWISRWQRGTRVETRNCTTMRCLSHPLLRRLLSLSPQHVPGRLSPGEGGVLSPNQFSLRQSCSAGPGLLTAADMVNYWQKVFETNGIPEARESSQYIVSFVLGAKTFQSLNSKSLHTPLTATQQEQIQQLSNKRLERMPVQYVLGEWDFQDLTLKMRPPVFIPRPETEDLVSLVVEEESQKCANSGPCFPIPVPHPVILEVGCGSGAIALSLLSKLPQSQVIAVDKEEAAVHLTRENAHRLQLQERIHIIHQDVSHSSAEQLLLWGPIDVLVSNPPYVFHEDLASLDAEILRYEDLDALDGGDDGMRVIKTILTLAPSLLKDSGSVFLEVDPRHPDMVEHWLQAHPNLPLTLRAVHKDFCGKPRFLHIQKQSR